MNVPTVELARVLGVSRQRINKLGQLGKISREPDGQWDIAKVHAELGRNLSGAQDRKARIPEVKTADSESTQNSHDMLNRARAVKETAFAKEAQLDLRARQGELLEAEDVEAAWTKGFTSFKNQLLLAIDKLAPKVAVCSSVLECRELIESEIFRALKMLSETKLDAVA